MAQDGGVPGANARKEGTHASVLGADMGLGSLVYITPHLMAFLQATVSVFGGKKKNELGEGPYRLRSPGWRGVNWSRSQVSLTKALIPTTPAAPREGCADLAPDARALGTEGVACVPPC